MSALAHTFSHGDDARAVFDKVRGFKSGVAEEIIKRSGGKVADVDDLVALAAEGSLGLRRCGTSLATCPHLPDDLRQFVLNLVDDVRGSR